MKRRRSFTNKPAVPAVRRRAVRRVTPHKLTKAEREIRRELIQALMSIRGMHIEDVYPPSDRDPSLAARNGSETAAPRRSTKRRDRRGETLMGAKRRSAPKPRAPDPTAEDEESIRAELLKALMSIRGKHIEDVFPPSDANDEVRT